MGRKEGVSISTTDKPRESHGGKRLFVYRAETGGNSQRPGNRQNLLVSGKFHTQSANGEPQRVCLLGALSTAGKPPVGSWWVDSGASVTSVARPRSQPFSSTSVTCLETRAPASQRGTLTTATPSTGKGATCSLVTEVLAGLCHRLHMSPAPSNSYMLNT